MKISLILGVLIISLYVVVWTASADETWLECQVMLLDGMNETDYYIYDEGKNYLASYDQTKEAVTQWPLPKIDANYIAWNDIVIDRHTGEYSYLGSTGTCHVTSPQPINKKN